MSSNEKNGGTAAKKSFFQLIKFGLVGIGNTLIDMVISTVLSIVLAIPFTGGWTVYVSKVVGYCAGILNSYILNSRWTFKEERRQDAREIISFIAVNLGVLLVSLGLIWLFTNALHIDDWWMSLGLPQWLTKIINGERACMLLSTCICIIVNFVGNKLFVFKLNVNTRLTAYRVKKSLGMALFGQRGKYAGKNHKLWVDGAARLSRDG